MRYTLDAPIFSNCWRAYAKRKKLEEEEYKHPINVEIRERQKSIALNSPRFDNNEESEENDNNAVSNDESQFAAVLRMRNCDILQALERAQKFVRRLRRSPSIPSGVQPLKIALAIGYWYFESLCKGLVQLRGADVNKGERLVEKGESLVRKGNSIIESGKRTLHLIAEYRSNGKHLLRPAITGKAYCNEVRSKIAKGETIVQQGKDIKNSGLNMLKKGFELMPKIPKRRSLKRYFEKQVKLATFQSSTPPELFEIDPNSDNHGEKEDEHDENLMVTADQYKTKTTTESTAAFLHAAV
jgi:hypothetical protein